jgi:hypothetical protein
LALPRTPPEWPVVIVVAEGLEPVDSKALTIGAAVIIAPLDEVSVRVQALLVRTEVRERASPFFSYPRLDEFVEDVVVLLHLGLQRPTIAAAAHYRSGTLAYVASRMPDDEVFDRGDDLFCRVEGRSLFLSPQARRGIWQVGVSCAGTSSVGRRQPH